MTIAIFWKPQETDFWGTKKKFGMEA